MGGLVAGFGTRHRRSKSTVLAHRSGRVVHRYSCRQWACQVRPLSARVHGGVRAPGTHPELGEKEERVAPFRGSLARRLNHRAALQARRPLAPATAILASRNSAPLARGPGLGGGSPLRPRWALHRTTAVWSGGGGEPGARFVSLCASVSVYTCGPSRLLSSTAVGAEALTPGGRIRWRIGGAPRAER